MGSKAVNPRDCRTAAPLRPAMDVQEFITAATEKQAVRLADTKGASGFTEHPGRHGRGHSFFTKVWTPRWIFGTGSKS